MFDLFKVRQEYGRTYFTLFPDGLSIPWHPLSLGEYLKYAKDYKAGIVPSAIIEDEIFSRCVSDPDIVRRLPFMKAGIVSAVAQNIWQYSGPMGIDEFNRDLDKVRVSLFMEENAALQDLIQIILDAFPYKPEEVYAMEYPVFLERLAQAERKLVSLGKMEPVEMKEKGQAEDEAHPPRLRSRRSPVVFADLNQDQPSVDPVALWKAQEERKTSPQHSPLSPPKVAEKKTQEPTNDLRKMSRDKWWKTSPVLETKNRKKIDVAGDEETAKMMLLDNDERASPPEVQEFLLNKKTDAPRKALIEDAQWIYKDLIAELEKKRKK